MRIETICTGDELLTGLTSDTNSRYFQEELLAHCGQVVQRSVVVLDDKNAIIEALDDAAKRCDVALVSGGLGPTSDDLTVDCAAAAVGVSVVEDPKARAHIEERSRANNFPLTPTSLRQARIPEGTTIELNAVGASPLIIQQRGRCTFFYVPGVPAEYRYLVHTYVVPRIAAMGAPDTVSSLLVLKSMGMTESHIADLVQPLTPRHPMVTFGYRAHAPEIHVKVLATAPTKAQADAAAAAAHADVMRLLGPTYYATGDASLASTVLDTLLARQQSLAVAESMTGGRILASLTEVPGASAALLGGAVTYVADAKRVLAQVPDDLLRQHGEVAAETASAMARGIRNALHATWGLSITGFAGPSGGTTENPVGTAFIAVDAAQYAGVRRLQFRGNRERIQRLAAATALFDLKRAFGG